MKNSIRHIVVYNQERIDLDLSFLEYIFLDLVAQLAQASEDCPGWCGVDKKELAELVGISERNLFRMIEKLLRRGILDQEMSQRKYLRPAPLWYKKVVLKDMGSKFREITLLEPDCQNGSLLVKAPSEKIIPTAKVYTQTAKMAVDSELSTNSGVLLKALDWTKRNPLHG